jgi:serine/threonine protein kinase
MNEAAIKDFAKTIAQRERADIQVAQYDAADYLQDLTRTRGILGSPQFMSPEQASGRHDLIGPSTDVYSIGATLYSLLTGCPMFSGSLFEVIDKVRNEWPIPAKNLVPSISDGVDAVIWKCIQKDPNRRYDSCESLAYDLERCLDGNMPFTLLKRKIRQNQREKHEAEEKQKYRDLWAQAFPPKDLIPNVLIRPTSKRWWEFWK